MTGGRTWAGLCPVPPKRDFGQDKRLLFLEEHLVIKMREPSEAPHRRGKHCVLRASLHFFHWFMHMMDS